MTQISSSTRRRLEIQGFEGFDDPQFAQVAPWLRFAMGLCTVLAAIGTLLASPIFLWGLVPIAIWAAASPVHPFDHLYNAVLRPLTGTPPLPRRGAPSRFACAAGGVMVTLTGWAFHAEAVVLGYLLGGLVTLVGLLVSTTDICVPSHVFRMIFGFPRTSKDEQ